MRSWLAKRPPDLAHAPRFPLWTWAKHQAVHLDFGGPDPGPPPFLHLSGSRIKRDEVEGAITNATNELNLIRGTGEEQI